MPLFGLGRVITADDVRAYYTKYYGKSANQEAVNVWLARPYSAEEAEVMIRDAGIADKLYTPSADEPVINVPVPTTTTSASSWGGTIDIAGISVSPLLLAAVAIVGYLALRNR
jgi:hypothetical protein